MRGSIVGLPDKFQDTSDNSKSYYKLITVLDLLFSALIVCPCVVSYWRSVWTLMDIYLLPELPLLSALVSTIIGVFGHLIFLLFQNQLENSFHPDKSRLLFYIVSRFYTICFAFTCVNGWRGLWDILTLQTETETINLIVTTLIGFVALISTRTLRNVSSPPCVIVNDNVKGYFDVLTMFRITAKENLMLFILDCLFSIMVVGTLVIFVWRGLWLVVDKFLFPNDANLSTLGSLILGYSIIAFVYLLQPLITTICAKLTGAYRLLFADFFIIFSLIGTINVWRGIWMSLDLYLLPDNRVASCWIVLTVSLVLLILLGCANSLLVRGVYIDAEEPNGKCVILPCYYFRLIFHEEKMKKLNKRFYTIENFNQNLNTSTYDNNNNNNNNNNNKHNYPIVTISGAIMEDKIMEKYSVINDENFC